MGSPGWSNIPGRFGKTTERVQAVDAFLSENTLPCTYIDSTKMSQPGLENHRRAALQRQGYREWSAAIFSSLEKAIAANPPKKAL